VCQAAIWSEAKAMCLLQQATRDDFQPEDCQGIPKRLGRASEDTGWHLDWSPRSGETIGVIRPDEIFQRLM
jgi:hypothetical protein